ncbi:MAG: hypothetical protein AB7J28_14740, partial [Hyphomonadaceae bacterium]
MLTIIRTTPLLIFPLLLYALFALTGGDDTAGGMAAPISSMALPSGAVWVLTKGHVATLFAALILFFEIIKSTRPTGAALVENVLSFLLFTISLILFLLVRAFGTTEFFLILFFMLVEFIAGAIVMILVARRDVGFTG